MIFHRNRKIPLTSKEAVNSFLLYSLLKRDNAFCKMLARFSIGDLQLSTQHLLLLLMCLVTCPSPTLVSSSPDLITIWEYQYDDTNNGSAMFMSLLLTQRSLNAQTHKARSLLTSVSACCAFGPGNTDLSTHIRLITE